MLYELSLESLLREAGVLLLVYITLWAGSTLGHKLLNRIYKVQTPVSPKERLLVALRDNESWEKEVYKALSAGAPPISDINAIMRHLNRAKRPERCLELYERLKAMNVELDQTTYVLLISACGPTTWQQAVQLLEDANERGVAISIVGQTQVIKTCAKAKQTDVAMAIFRRLKSGDKAPDLMTYNTVISACGPSQPAMGVRLFQEVREAGLAPDLVTYNTLINCCCCGSEHESKVPGTQLRWHEYAAELLTEMKGQGVLPDLISYNSAIAACAQAGDHTLAICLLAQAEGLGLSPDGTTYGNAIGACLKGGELSTAIGLSNRMQKNHIQPVRSVNNHLIQGLVAAEKWDEAAQFLMTLGCNVNAPDKVVYNSVITGCVRAGKLQLAASVLKVTPDPDSYSFHAAISGCARIRDWVLGMEFVELIEKNNVTPNHILYYAVISMCDRANQWQRALEFFERAKRDCTIQGDLYTMMVRASSRRAQFPYAQKLIGEMKAAGHQPSESLLCAAMIPP